MTTVLSGITLIFDLDGTLVDTAPDLIAALNHSLLEAGHEGVTDKVIRPVIGNGAKAMLRQSLSFQGQTVDEGNIQTMFETFLDHYAANIAENSRPFSGCLAALDRLAEAGATLTVCTNKTQRLADLLLCELAMTKRFAAIVGADSVANKKPHGNHLLETLERAGTPNQVAVMFGDSQTDERAALHAELPFVYCPFGYGPIDHTPLADRTILTSYSKLNDEFVSALLS